MAPPGSRISNLPRRPLFAALLLVACAFLAYQPALRGGFIWDDDIYLTGNALIQAPDGWQRFWTSGEAIDYYPLSSTMLWIEWRIWGAKVAGYRLVNLLLHAGCGILLWRILRRYAGALAWPAALLFVLHPANAEAVAWIAQRKTVLAAAFALGSVLLWHRADERRSAGAYAASLALFLASLLSKTTAVALPVALLAIAWARAGRLTRRDFARAAPYFALSLALGLVTAWFQRHHAIAHLDVRPEGFASKLAGTGWTAWFYLGKFLFPHPLAICYPRWTIDPGVVSAWAPLLAGLLAVAALWRQRTRWGRWPFALALAYLALLAPLLGLVDIGFMMYALAADHWQYHAMPALCVLAAGLAARPARRAPRAAGLAAAALGIGLLLLTRQHAAVMADEFRVWTHNVQVYPDVWMGRQGLATAQLQAGRLDEAEVNFLRALELNPASGGAQANLGALYAMRGDPTRARPHLEAALKIDPRNPNTLFNLGRACELMGDRGEAARLYSEVLTYRPDDLSALFNIAHALLEAPEGAGRDAVRARAAAERACRITGFQNLYCLEIFARATAAAGAPADGARIAEQAAALARGHGLADETSRFEALAAELGR